MALDELKTVRVDRCEDGRVAEVVLDNGKGNPLDGQFWDELPEVFPALDADPDVRAILLRGEGRHFCTGLDLREALAIMKPAGGVAAERDEFMRWVRMAQRGISAMEDCRKPVVAAVQGGCIGGGVDLICAADIRLASADAVFSVREVRVGVVSDGGSLQRLPALIGESAARRLILTGEDFDAGRAERYGLVSDVYPDPETLLVEARTMCAHLAGLSPRAVQGSKHALNVCRNLTHREGLEFVAIWNSAFMASDDLNEAVTSFAERRPPRYTGR
jgi:enoyl-CoA hydratase